MELKCYGPYKEIRGGNETWRVVLISGRGKGRSQKAHKFDDERSALRFARAAQTQIERQSQMTVAEALDAYKEYLRRVGRTESTLERYGNALQAMLGHLSTEPVSEISADDAERAYELCVPGRAPATHRTYLCRAKAMFGWLLKTGVLSSNPFDAVIGTGRVSAGKHQLGIDECRTLIDACEAEDSPGATAIMTVLLLGLRPGELMNARPADIDDNGRLFRVQGPHLKTPAARRDVEIPERIRERLVRHLPLFGRGPFVAQYKKPTAWLRFELHRLCETAKLPRVTTHSLRGSHTSLARAAGATSHLVAQAIGHTSTRVTHKHYITPQAEHAATQQAALRVLNGGK